jgi:dUTP pyrophosphatase
MSKEVKIEAAKMFDALNKIEVEVLDGGQLPMKANKSDAGFDVFATEDVVIYPGEVIKHPLNIKLNLPVGTWARIETKSGLGSKGMLVYAGVIDRGYRGVPHVVCTNMKMKKKEERTVANIINPNLPGTETEEVIVDNDEPIVIRKGEKIAQITMNPHCEEFYMVQVDAVNDDTDRGAGGFGSTGK